MKSLSPVERVADKLTTINTAIAIEALFKHTNKAISIRTKANRTTYYYRLSPHSRKWM